MKREEYLSKLKLTLQGEEFAQVEEAIAYFDELLQDRMADENLDEEAAVATMDPPEKAAAMLHEYSPPQERSERAGEAGQAGGETPFAGVKTIRVKAEGVRAIRVRDRNMRIILTGGKGGDIVIRHPESERVKYDFALEDGRLALIRQPWDLSLGLFQSLGLDREMREVRLEVPEDLASELDLHTSNAGVDVRGVNLWGQALLATSNASVTLSQLTAKRLEATASNGSISLEGVRAAADVTAVTSNAKIRANGVVAPQALTLKTSNSSIHVEAVTSREITLTTSNGAVKGTLPGSIREYSVQSATSNGKNSLPARMGGGDKQLQVRTSNGTIDLRFEKE